MNGCIFKRKLPSGKISWGYSIDIGHDERGRRKQLFKSGFNRKGDAEDARRKALNDNEAGEIVKPDPSTFQEFMAEWFKEHAEKTCSAKTVERYRELAAYAYPHIGRVRIQDLTALTLQRVFNKLKDCGGRNRKTKKPRPLSAKTVRHIAGVVHTAFTTAIEWGLLKSNPCITKNLPKVQKREAVALDAAQLAWYADAARAAGLYEFLMVAAATGCRRGELLALTWPDVDLSARTLSISKSLEQTRNGLRVKSTKSEKPRQISLPASTVELLRAMSVEQEHRRSLFGPDYRSDLNLVFCAPDGNYLKPDTVTAKACLIAKKAGLKDTSIHSLRHSHGSQLLSAGVSLPAVSKRLGHSSVYVTSTVYSHALSKDETAAAEAWEASVHDVIERDRKARIS